MKGILYDYPFLFVFLSLVSYAFYLKHYAIFWIFLFLSLLSLFRLKIFILSLLFVLATFILSFVNNNSHIPQHKKEFSGVIFNLKKSKMLSVYVKTDYGKMCLFAPTVYDNLYIGDKIVFKSNIKPINHIKNKGFRNYLSSIDVLYYGYAFFIHRFNNNTLYGYMQSVRKSIEKEFSYFLGKSEFVFLQSAIFGNTINRSFLRKMFIDTQTAHLLAVSGMHMGFVFTMFFVLIYKIVSRVGYLYRRFNIKIVASLMAFVPVFLYFLISGMHIPAIRSFVMVVIFIVALIFGYTKNAYNILLFVASVFIVLFGYKILFNISFVLSFFMSFVAIFLYSFIKDRSMGKIGSYIMFSFLMSIFAMPISAFYFHKISYISILSNLFAVPYFGGLIMPLSFVAIFFSFLPYSYIKYAVFKILNVCVFYFLKTIKLFSALSPYQVDVSLGFVVGFYFVLFLSFYYYKTISTSSK